MRDGRIGIIDDNDFVNSECFDDINYYVYPVGDKVNYEMYLAKDIKLFNEKEDKQMTSEELGKYLDENLPKVKFEEPRVFKVTIEEHISETFEIEATDMEEAMELAEQRYWSGEYVLASDASVNARLMKGVDIEKDEETEWTEF